MIYYVTQRINATIKQNKASLIRIISQTIVKTKADISTRPVSSCINQLNLINSL
jgi:hypothetical protein